MRSLMVEHVLVSDKTYVDEYTAQTDEAVARLAARLHAKRRPGEPLRHLIVRTPAGPRVWLPHLDDWMTNQPDFVQAAVALPGPR